MQRAPADRIEATEEAWRLAERFGAGAEVVFDGPAERCPICEGTISQLALILDLAGVEPASCSSCGVLAA